MTPLPGFRGLLVHTTWLYCHVQPHVSQSEPVRSQRAWLNLKGINQGEAGFSAPHMATVKTPEQCVSPLPEKFLNAHPENSQKCSRSGRKCDLMSANRTGIRGNLCGNPIGDLPLWKSQWDPGSHVHIPCSKTVRAQAGTFGLTLC